MATEEKGKVIAPKEEADLQERIKGFNEEILPLLGKYELGLAAIAKVTGDGRIVADPVIVSVRKQPTPPAPATPHDPPVPPVEGKKPTVTDPDA